MVAQIDHEASHSNLINQFLHLISSLIFLYCYAIFFQSYRQAVYLGLASLILRQSGHYIFEPPCHEKEQAMLGFDTISKVKICIVYFVLPTLFLIQLTQIEAVNAFITKYDVQVADLWVLATFAIVGGRVVVLWNRYGFIVSQHWFIKFITDPFTDIPAYYRSAYQIFNPKLRAYAISLKVRSVTATSITSKSSALISSPSLCGSVIWRASATCAKELDLCKDRKHSLACKGRATKLSRRL